MCENLVGETSAIGKLQHTEFLKLTFLYVCFDMGDEPGFVRLCHSCVLTSISITPEAFQCLVTGIHSMSIFTKVLRYCAAPSHPWIITAEF